MTITQKINMDLARRGVTPRVPAVQGDSYTRVVEISLYENGAAWPVPENASVLLRFRKPDGTGGLYDTLPDGAPAWSAAEHVVQVTLAPQVLAVPGVVQAQLEIVLDAQTIASFTFHVYVEGDPSNGAAASEEYFNWNDWANKALNEAVKDITSDYVRTVNGIVPDENGDVEFEIPVTSVNGMTGDVVIEIPEAKIPVTSVNGQTGDVVIEVGGGDSVQPDWNQNDETAADYVKNRTHWTNEEGWEITWDWNGDTSSIENSVGPLGPYMFNYVSAEIPTDEELKQCQIVVVDFYNGAYIETSVNVADSWDDLVSAGAITDDYAVLVNGSVIITRKDNVECAGLTFPKAGAYFIYAVNDSSYSYTRELSKPWDVKKIDSAFLPDDIVGKKGLGVGAEVFNYYDGNDANKAFGAYSHAEGYGTTANSRYSHAEGWTSQTREDGYAAHAEGWYTLAQGTGAHVEGCHTEAHCTGQHVEGINNIADDDGQYVHIVGNGNFGGSSTSNAYTLDWSGNAVFAGIVSGSGADYAEYFEWVDGNPNGDDRIGLMVTLDGDKIRCANVGDEILGIVSGTAVVLGDNAEWEWDGKYLRDDYGRVISEVVEEFIEIENPKTKVKEQKSLGFFPRRKLNPDYNPEQKYVRRSDRPEWETIGLLGKLYATDDGSCVVGGYATTGENGIATASAEKTNIRVMKRITDSIVLVFMK